jgi:hypothetical protein
MDIPEERRFRTEKKLLEALSYHFKNLMTWLDSTMVPTFLLA